MKFDLTGVYDLDLECLLFFSADELKKLKTVNQYFIRLTLMAALGSELRAHLKICQDINADVTINEKSLSRYNGLPPVLIAAQANFTFILEYIVSMIPNINCTDNLGNTPVHYACRKLNPRILLALLSIDDVSNTCLVVKNKNGETPFNILTKDVLRKDAERRYVCSEIMARYLQNYLNYYPYEQLFSYDLTPEHNFFDHVSLCIRRGQSEPFYLQRFHIREADLNMFAYWLNVAIQNGSRHLVEIIILSYGYKCLGAITSDYRFLNIEYESKEAEENAIAHRATVIEHNQRSMQQATNAMSELVNYADGSSGNTPLHSTAKKQDIKLTKLIAKYGALNSLSKVNNNGKNPVEVSLGGLNHSYKRRHYNSTRVYNFLIEMNDPVRRSGVESQFELNEFDSKVHTCLYPKR